MMLFSLLQIIGMEGEKFDRLFLSVKEFKDLSRKEFPKQTPEKPISISTKDNFESLIRLVNEITDEIIKQMD